MNTMFSLNEGALLALGSMALATYLCRIGGIWLMDHLPPSPALKRALQALPGSIILATVIPLGMRGGLSALCGLAAAMLIMALTRKDIFALAGGMAMIIGLRQLGF
jgi:uncharacterized membrane protein